MYATLAYVVDGDTIRLRGGTYVRLVQIDAPGSYTSTSATASERRSR